MTAHSVQRAHTSLPKILPLPFLIVLVYVVENKSEK
jgi:hypothetical protein